MNHDCSKCEANLECRITLACREEHDNLETIFWHPYPQEKPTVSDWYLVTLRGRFIQFDAWNIDSKWTRYSDEDVVAWAERPKPYGV